jgi:hypothetical protein
MTKCRFCDDIASVWSEWGYICGKCYFTLKGFERGVKLEEMRMEDLQTLERIYSIWIREYNEVLQMIKTEIEKRRTG